MDRLRAVGAIVVSVVAAGLAVWWLYEVAIRLSIRPVTDASGAVVLDEFQRAKDILLVVLPLFSASLAYWVGSQGTAAAKQDAADAKDKLLAVLDVSPEGVLKDARDKHPEAFKV